MSSALYNFIANNPPREGGLSNMYKYFIVVCQSELVEDLVKRTSLRQAQTDSH
jgi:hypothetical protein